MTEEDRVMIRDLIKEHAESRFAVTHGTDTMVQTAQAIGQLPGKTVILTGALSPARFKGSDALFNLGSAVGAVQAIDEGTFISMNGNLFNPENVQKNRAQNRFESA